MIGETASTERLQAGGGGLQFKLFAATPPKLTSIVVLPLKVTLSTKKKYPSLALTVTEAIGPPPTFKAVSYTHLTLPTICSV